jgi:mono/diheme cytochrome c family protein
MRNRNIFLALSVIVLGLLLLLAGGSSSAKGLQATDSSTTVATEQDVTAMCEVFRTIPNVVATAAPDDTTAGTPAAPAEIARPSNSGGPGDAVKLVGDPKAGEKIYTDNCQKCHGDLGAGGIKNPGSDDGEIPALNPIDETIVDTDGRVFACNIDLFLEHGSVPSGPSPKETMQPWGDNKVLTAQQMADVESYIITLNGGSPATGTPEPTGTPAAS